MHAGLIHALKQGATKDLYSERWLYETMKPGRDPLGELARVTSSFAGTLNAGEDIRTKGLSDATVLAQWCEIALKDGRDRRAVLFVDQFEEVFTQVGTKKSERVAFLNMLTHAANVENGRLIILFSMRSDFVSNCATYPQLNALLNQQFVQIGAMQPEELVSAIAQPAFRVGLRIDPDLIAQIINDMQGEPGALPLMQFALKDLFDAEQAKGGVIVLTLTDYIQRGGIRKSLERRADDSFAKLSEKEQELARSIFSGLIEIGLGTQDTRRTALFDELIPAGTQYTDVQAVIQKLADARLITTDKQDEKETVTLAHEKLIDAWPWLKKLVNDNRDVIALQNEIAADAKEWDDHKRDASYLYSGGRLINAREQLKSKKLVLSELAQQFVQAGCVRQLRSQMGLIVGISAVIVLLILAAIIFGEQSSANAQLARQNAIIANTAQAASTFAIAQQVTAQANAKEAQSQLETSRAGELANQSVALRDSNPLVSWLLGIEAFKTQDTLQARSALMSNVQSNPPLQMFLGGNAKGINSVAFSPDGKTLASGVGYTIILWDMVTKRPIGQPLMGHTAFVSSVAFSPDGKTLASSSFDNTVILWNVATQQPIGQALNGNTGFVSSVAFSPDGKELATGSYEKTIILWDAVTHQQIGQPLMGHADSVNSVVFSPDGKTLASGSDDNTIILWNVATQQPIGSPMKGYTSRECCTDAIVSIAFSPDGKTLASGSDDGTIMLWDVGTRRPISPPLSGHTMRVTSVAFSPDGKTLASGSYDRTIILWDMATQQPIGQTLRGHTDFVLRECFKSGRVRLENG